MNQGSLNIEQIKNLLHRLPDCERADFIAEELQNLPIEYRSAVVAHQLPIGFPSQSEALTQHLQNLPADALIQLLRAVNVVVTDRIQ
jgi:hypothetical protein